MNQKTKHSLCLSLMLLVGAALYLGGCGPENLDDPYYLAQLSDSGIISDAADKDAEPMKGQEDEKEMPKDMARDKRAMPEGRMGMPEGAPVAGVAGAAVPVPVVELPPEFIELPPEAVANPPIVFNTEEDRLFQRERYFEKQVHVSRPTVEEHLIRNNVVVNNKYHTTVIDHPSFAREVAVTGTYAETDEVLPTTEVVAPTVYGGTFFDGGFDFGWGWGIPCAPWLSGGFYRYCSDSPYGGAVPPYVVGPYFR